MILTKRYLVALLVTLFIGARSKAQSLNGTVLRLAPSTIPTYCNTGDLRVDQNSGYVLKICAANTWTVFGAALPNFTAGQVLFGNGSNTPSAVPGFFFDSTNTAASVAGNFTAAKFVGNLLGNVTGSLTGTASFATTAANAGIAAFATTASSTSTAANAGIAAFASIAAVSTAFATVPSACSANQYALGISTVGNLTCAQIGFSQVTSFTTIAQGGTNNTTLAVTNGGVLYTNGTRVMNSGVGTASQVLISNGAAAPTWADGVPSSLVSPVIQAFNTTGGATYYPDYIFTITSGTATAASTYTNNAITCTTEYTISPGTTLIMACQGVPLTSGNLVRSGGGGDATIAFSAYQRPRYIEVIASAGGGGGGGSTTPTGAGTGGTTLFGALINCTGGAWGTDQGTPGLAAGGTCTVTSASQDVQVIGNYVGGTGSSGSGAASSPGYPGGVNPLGGISGGVANSVNGQNGIANTGAGGGGCGSNGATNGPGGGGGAGGYVDLIMRNYVALSQTVSVGAGGTGRAGVKSGGNGGSGVVIVKQYY